MPTTIYVEKESLMYTYWVDTISDAVTIRIHNNIEFDPMKNNLFQS